MSSPRKQRLRSSPAHSWTPTMPKMKKTKKQRRRTFPSMGRVSNSSVTKIRIPRGHRKTKMASEIIILMLCYMHKHLLIHMHDRLLNFKCGAAATLLLALWLLCTLTTFTDLLS